MSTVTLHTNRKLQAVKKNMQSKKKERKKKSDWSAVADERFIQ